jgi:membrane associated rhomboid family serine protease
VLFPYKDDNPTILTPYVTVAAIIVTTLVWVFFQGAGAEPGLSQSVCDLGVIPNRLFGGEIRPVMTQRGPLVLCPDAPSLAWHTVVTSVFLHGGWFHLIGNMWFLWVFGNNIEDAMGHGRFVAFYLFCGVLAALAQIVVQPGSPVPMVGASGAISGILGAYLVLYPKARVHLLVVLFVFFTRVTVPAYLMLLYWVFLQVLGGLPTFAGASSGGGVAFLAHLGGFFAGFLTIRLFARPELLKAHRARPVVETHTRRPTGLF